MVRVWLAAVFLICSAAGGAQSPLKVPLYVVEPTGIPRVRENVTSGLPFPAGALKDGASVRLRDEKGLEAPLQTRVLSRWNDGSVKWLLIDFPTSVAAGAYRKFTFEAGAGVAMRSSTPAEKGELDDLSVYAFNCRGAKVQVDGKPIEQPTVAAAEKQSPFKFDMAGPNRRREKLSSTDFIDSAFRSLLSLNARTQAAAGCPGQTSTISLLQVSDKATLKVTQWDTPLVADSTIKVAVIGLDGAPVRVVLKPTDRLELVQSLETAFTLTKNGQVIASGKRAPGWITVSDGQLPQTVAVRDFARQWPIGLSITGKEVLLRAAIQPLELARGTQKTFDLFTVDGVSAGEGQRLAKAFQRPLFAQAEPKWYGAYCGFEKSLSLPRDSVGPKLLLAAGRFADAQTAAVSHVSSDPAGQCYRAFLHAGELKHLQRGGELARQTSDTWLNRLSGDTVAPAASPVSIQGLLLWTVLTGDTAGLESAIKIAQNARRQLSSSDPLQLSAAMRIASDLAAFNGDERMVSAADRGLKGLAALNWAVPNTNLIGIGRALLAYSELREEEPARNELLKILGLSGQGMSRIMHRLGEIYAYLAANGNAPAAEAGRVMAVNLLDEALSMGSVEVVAENWRLIPYADHVPLPTPPKPIKPVAKPKKH